MRYHLKRNENDTTAFVVGMRFPTPLMVGDRFQHNNSVWVVKSRMFFNRPGESTECELVVDRVRGVEPAYCDVDLFDMMGRPIGRERWVIPEVAAKANVAPQRKMQHSPTRDENKRAKTISYIVVQPCAEWATAYLIDVTEF